MPFFKKLAGQATNVFKKASGGLDVGLRKIGNTGGDISGAIQKAKAMSSQP